MCFVIQRCIYRIKLERYPEAQSTILGHWQQAHCWAILGPPLSVCGPSFCGVSRNIWTSKPLLAASGELFQLMQVQNTQGSWLSAEVFAFVQVWPLETETGDVRWRNSRPSPPLGLKPFQLFCCLMHIYFNFKNGLSDGLKHLACHSNSAFDGNYFQLQINSHLVFY